MTKEHPMQDHDSDNQTTEGSNNHIDNRQSVENPIQSDTNEETITDSSEPVASGDEHVGQAKEESRARQVFRKFIRWVVGLLIVFGFGFLTAVFTIYNPKVDQLDQSQSDLNGAGTTIDELESQINIQQGEVDNLNNQIDALNQKVESLENDKQGLYEQQDQFNLQVALLKARADVVSAQVELYEGNPAQARVLLESTDQSLTTIESLLPDDLKDVVEPLQNRLDLAIGEIENDIDTAIADLSILAGDLLEIENALFKE
jgi:hypothetical protein